MNIPGGREFIFYFVVGGLAFLADFSVFMLLTDVLSVHYLYANIAGFSLGLVVNYSLCVRWVFTYRKYLNLKREFLIFTAIGLVGLLIGELVLFVLVDFAALSHGYAKIIMTAIVFCTNFVVRKLLLFSPARN